MDEKKRPCIERACENCVEARLVEEMYAIRASAFEDAAKMVRVEAAEYFKADKDEMARAFRDYSKKFDKEGTEYRKKQKAQAELDVVCSWEGPKKFEPGPHADLEHDPGGVVRLNYKE